MKSTDIFVYNTNNVGIWNWLAFAKNYEQGDKIGYGLTKRFAILSLVEQMVDDGEIPYEYEDFKEIFQEDSSYT